MADFIRLKIEPLRRLGPRIRQAFANPQSYPTVMAMWRQVAVRYLAQAQRQFRDASRGALDWPPLKLATMLRRRAANPRVQRTRQQAIAALSAGQAPPAVETLRGWSVSLGIAKSGALMPDPQQRQHAVLIQTGTLQRALQEGAPGNLIEVKPNQLRVGIGDSGRAMKKTAKGQTAAPLTIGRLAAFHHFGRGHNPVRRILRPPTPETLAGVKRDQQAAIAKLTQEITRG